MSRPATPRGPARGISARARALIAAVILVSDLAQIWIFATFLGYAGREIQFRMGVIVVASAAVGAACLLVVIGLNLSRKGGPRETRPNRNTVVSVLSVVAFVKLAGVLVAFLLIGAATDVAALEMAVVCVAESAVVIGLIVGTTRHLATLTG